MELQYEVPTSIALALSFMMCKLSVFGWLIFTLCYAFPAKGQTGDSLVMTFKNGKTTSIALSQIKKITFDSLKASVPIGNNSAQSLEVMPSYPNPSSAGATIGFTLVSAGNVSIIIYDSKGNLVRLIDIPNCSIGQNQIKWDGLDKNGLKVPSGAYFYEVRYKNEVQVRNMVIIK